jgi:membrane protein
LLVAIWLMLTMDRSLNAIWRVRRARPYWISALGYATLLMLGPVLIVASVSFTTYVMTLSNEVTGFAPRVHTFLLRAFPVLMSTFAFFLIYRIIPHRHVPWRHALLGAAVAAVLFESAKQLFSMYVSVTPTYNIVYGALAAIPIFLIWIYLSWLVVLFGAELTAAAAWWQGGRWKSAPRAGIRFREAVIIVRAMIDAPGGRMKFDELRGLTLMSPEELDETLADMVEAGLLKARGRSGYELGAGTREVLSAPRAPQPDEAPVTKAGRGKARNARSSR